MHEERCLEMIGIEKHFPGVHALKQVDFSLEKGEIHGLLGENGAGKSTLMKALGGVEPADSGTIRIYGENVRMHTPKDADVPVGHKIVVPLLDARFRRADLGPAVDRQQASCPAGLAQIAARVEKRRGARDFMLHHGVSSFVVGV